MLTSLKNWAEENQQHPMYELATRLLDRASERNPDPDLIVCLTDMGERGCDPTKVCSMLWQAINQTTRDLHRLPPEKERRSIEDVRNKSIALIESIESCPAISSPFLVNFNDDPAWMTTRKISGLIDFPQMDITSSLRTLIERCEVLLELRPANALTRKTRIEDRATPRGVAFWMACIFRNNGLPHSPTRIAALVNLACPDSNWTADDVGSYPN